MSVFARAGSEGGIRLATQKRAGLRRYSANVPRSPTDIIAEIDSVLGRAKLAPGEPVVTGQYGTVPGFRAGEVVGLTTAFVAAIDRLSPASNRYREIARAEIESKGPTSGYALTALAGILNALRADYESGYTATVDELVHAEVFGDFIEMAAELLGKGYKDPAAVLIGSVLEEHLRALATKHGVSTVGANGKPLKADTLNADLVKATAYNVLMQKQITAWLDLRNKAAHGKYSEYNTDYVALMLEGVRTFLINSPA